MMKLKKMISLKKEKEKEINQANADKLINLGYDHKFISN